MIFTNPIPASAEAQAFMARPDSNATTSQEGIVELLTQAELDTAVDTTRVPTADILRVSIHAAALSF